MSGTTANERVNMVIVVGLLALAFMIVGAGAFIYVRTRTVPSEVWMLISAIVGALSGFLAKEFSAPKPAAAPPGGE